jgi:DNA-binding GntR family transcriptional regulator
MSHSVSSPAAESGSPVPGADGRQTRRKADGVYAVMLNRLISQEIGPGQRITVYGISRDLRVSQTPVREALTRLESDGLVTKIHLVGYRATDQLTRKQFEDLFEVRLLLEPVLAAKAALNRTDEQRDAMLDCAAVMRQMASKPVLPTYGEFALEDAKLHDLVAVSAGNEIARESLSRLHPHLHLFRLYYHERVPPMTLMEHQLVVDAIVSQSPDAARIAMEQHLDRSRVRLGVAFD